jgi:hypothetical protein
MTIYATGNPVGSTNPKDLLDNAQNLDYLILGPLLSYPDRRGVNRLSWAGIEASFSAAQAQRAADFNAAQAQRAADYAASEANRGYENPVPYAASITLTRVTQLVQYNSELYKAKAGTLPWTTTGVWATDSAKLVSVGDNALRQSLASNSGTDFIFGTQPIAGSVSRQLTKKLAERVTSGDSLTGAEADASSILQGMINDLSTASIKQGQREFVINKKHNIGTALNIPSNMRVIFEKDAELIPTVDYINALNSIGALPGASYVLTLDAANGGDRVRVGANYANFVVGNYVWIQSDALIITSPNIQNLTKAQMSKVVGIDSGLGELILSTSLEYDFLISANAKVGVADCRENVTVEGLVYGKEGNTKWCGLGIDFRVHSNLKLDTIRSGYSRTVPSYDEAYEVINRNAINLRHILGAKIDDVAGRQIAWYMMSLDGACQNIKVNKLETSWARHGFSTNWNGPGMPINVSVHGITTNHTTYGGMDTHDVGRDITFTKTRVRHAKYEGGQIRCSDVTVDDYEAEYCGGNGLLVYGQNSTVAPRLTGTKLKNIRVNYNGKRGLLADVPIDVEGLVCIGNGAAYSLTDAGGVSLPGGSIKGARIEDNNGAAVTYFGVNNYAAVKAPVTLRDVSAPASAKQNVFLNSTQTYEGQGVKLRDCRAVGYTTANLLRRDGSSFITEIDDRGCVWGTSTARRGKIQLAAGTATVAHDSVRTAGTDAGQNWSTTIHLRRITQSAAPGHLSVSLVDSTSFTITSSNSSDQGIIEWTLG